MHDRGHTVLNKLVNNCLLEKVMIDNVKEGVKMHDVVRDMALSIDGGDHFMVKAGIELEDIPSEPKWKESLEKVSLMNNSISEIPLISPKCPNLSTLLLQNNLNLEKILGSFFEHMHGLKVLDLSHTGICYLPNSISNLTKLTALILRLCCQLRHLPSLAKLTTLRKLDLFHTAINAIPHGIEMLENLTYLNLYARGLKDLPMGIISRFSKLQVLKAWLNSKGEEAAKLSKLETVLGAFHVLQDFEGYAKSLPSQGPTKYWLGVGSPKPGYFGNHPWFNNLEDVEVDKE
ncbi:hypothetical protein Golob_021087, partial [Gossypium lobatum]|nr:hypothetical protein [Gossypium lobatum]